MQEQMGRVYLPEAGSLQTPQAKYDHSICLYVVPLRFRSHELCYLHQNPLAGQFGLYRTTAAAVRCLFWPRMSADIEKYVKCCLRCEMAKLGPGKGPKCLWSRKSLVLEMREEPLTLLGHYPRPRMVIVWRWQWGTISQNVLWPCHYADIQLRIWWIQLSENGCANWEAAPLPSILTEPQSLLERLWQKCGRCYKYIQIHTNTYKLTRCLTSHKLIGFPVPSR